MKKIIKSLIVLLILTVFAVSGCGQKDTPTSSSTEVGDSSPIVTPSQIVITCESEVIEIKDTDVDGYDYRKHFSITEGGLSVIVNRSYIDASSVKAEAGEYTVTCSYKGEVASIRVVVIQTVYEVILTTDKITLNKAYALDYDYLSLFSASIDGVQIEITQDMITSNVLAEEGEYQFTVTNGSVSKTLTVVVLNAHNLLVVATYPNFKIAQSEVYEFDYTKLFALYVNDVFTEVTTDMLDLSELTGATAGNTYQIGFSYQVEESIVQQTAKVQVVQDEELVINAKNLITYPNSEFIDLTTLFQIKKGNKEIPVTNDMVMGSIDYSSIGVNQIYLNYQGQTAVATVEVKLGAIINYAKGDTVIIRKGTNQADYSFANDFVLLVNGIRFTSIEAFIDLSEVNFDEVGSYVATLRVPYNDKALGISGVRFDYIESQITYVVVQNEYTCSILEEQVELAYGTTRYDPTSNLKLVLNGRNQSFTDNPDYVDVLTTYYQDISAPIDFNSNDLQQVTLELYVNGVYAPPITVSFYLFIQTGVTITAEDLVVYSGQTVYTTDLFKVSKLGEKIEVTYDMVSGKVDTLHPGLYEVVCEYQGESATARVIVLDNAIKGTYATKLHTIATNSSDYDEEYGDTQEATRNLGDLIINTDGSIKVLGYNCEVTGVIDANTIELTLRSNKYVMHYFDGIIVLDPNNDIKLEYNPDKRPLIYFHKDVWSLEDRLVINQYSDYVLNAKSPTYSIDAFKITNKKTNQSLWYALKVSLVEKMNSDTVYKVEWGEITFNSDLAFQVNAVNEYTFDGITQRFTMTDSKQGKVNVEASSKEFANLLFTGTVNGQSAQLATDQYEGFTLKVGSQILMKATSYNISQMANGYVDHANCEVFLYDFEEYVYSYKFKLNLANKTFTIVQKDNYFGKYEIDGMYIFLDGYGSGIVNFDTRSYYKYQFVYSVLDSKIEIRYINTKQSFKYGDHAVLFMDAFNNVLTANYFEDASLIGKRFVNSAMTDGIVVQIDSFVVGADSDTVARAKLLSNIHIYTADGEVSESEKSSYVNTKLVRFNTAGFYKFTISATVNGEQVEVPYTVQVLPVIYENNPVVATYGAGVIFNTNSMMIDKYGQAIVRVGDITYNGCVKVFEDNSFVINATSGAKTIKLNATQIADGVILAVCTGSSTFSDYFTTGEHFISGTKGYMLRTIQSKDGSVYVRSIASTAIGSIVSVQNVSGSTTIEGSVVKVIEEDGTESYVKILAVNNTDKGLVLADSMRGSYTADDASFTLDGFGKVVLNGVSGTYKTYGKVVTLKVGSSVTLYRVNTDDFTAVNQNVVPNNTILEGQVFSYTYNFFYDNYLYQATTTFTFATNGVVKVISTSSEFTEDAGEPYAPPFASETGVAGSYSVHGDTVTVTVNGYSFTFEIDYLLNPSALTCISTTLADGEHGYFATGSVFVK